MPAPDTSPAPVPILLGGPVTPVTGIAVPAAPPTPATGVGLAGPAELTVTGGVASGAPLAAAAVLRVLTEADTVDALLDSLVPVLAAALPGCDAVGIALLRDGSPLAVAASEPVVRAVTQAQYRHGAGPCLTATATGQPVLTDDADPHDRDAEWRTLARDAGLATTLAVPLPGPDEVAGALVFHRRDASPWPGTATATAGALANYVGQALTVLVRREPV